MSPVVDPISGMEITDLTSIKTLLIEPISIQEIELACNDLILSASGWRKVFVDSAREEDTASTIGAANALLAGLMMVAFAEFLKLRLPKKANKINITIACDTRPTGNLIADAMILSALAQNIQINYVFIASAPEHFAYARLESEIDAFAYISASHNPIGHNGVKFGLNTGGVLGGEDARELIQMFQNIIKNPEKIEACRIGMLNIPNQTALAVYKACPKNKQKSLESYQKFMRIVLADSNDIDTQQACINSLLKQNQKAGLGVLAELNGSARTLTIDQDFLNQIGVKVQVVNGLPRQIVHRIVPEGQSLDQCRLELEKAWQVDRGFQLAYVPDNDGDRGNLVWLEQKTARAHIIEAQEVFALAVLAELSFLVYSGKIQYDNHGKTSQKVAVAVNCPTSLRIEELAECFGAKVFRAEVGEANVVNIAINLRKKGYIVRILGEGSNGGNITHPAAVRDPLATVISVLKLLTIRSQEGKIGLFEIYCQLIGIKFKPEFDLGDILASLPKYMTTSAYEDRAILKIQTTDHAVLKSRYESIFLQEWEVQKSELKKRFSIHSWEEINYEGIQEFRGLGKNYRTGKERGGFKILFKDALGKAIAFLWMRGSGTEPVFRISADIKSFDPHDEAWLLKWHMNMVKQADKAQ